MVPLLAIVAVLAACDNPLALSTDHLTLQVLQSVGKLPDDPLTVTGALVRSVGARSLRFEIVEPGEKLSKVGERLVDF